jgi:hypothetical protein
MNERIQELYLQASYNIIETNCAPIISNEFNKEKFAELIVRECARIAFDESAHAGRMNKPGNCLFGNNIGRRIEKHFGVE